MRKRLLVFLGLVVLPAWAFAQCSTQNCGQCYLQLFDDPAMTQVTGTIAPLAMKDIYLGLKFADPETGFTGVEFSIAGMDGLTLLSKEYPNAMPNLELGTPPAPPDTTGTATGGMSIAWPMCQAGSQAFMKMTVLAFAPVTNKVLKPTRRFPTTNQTCFPTQSVFTRCDGPTFTTVKVNTNNCYILNWDGHTAFPCVTPIREHTWTAVKKLYGGD
jgi:hypothetical protein